jgi:hypothetical protein
MPAEQSCDADLGLQKDMTTGSVSSIFVGRMNEIFRSLAIDGLLSSKLCVDISARLVSELFCGFLENHVTARLSEDDIEYRYQSRVVYGLHIVDPANVLVR